MISQVNGGDANYVVEKLVPLVESLHNDCGNYIYYLCLFVILYVVIIQVVFQTYNKL